MSILEQNLSSTQVLTVVRGRVLSSSVVKVKMGEQLSIIDHKKYARAIDNADGFMMTQCGQQHPKITTKDDEPAFKWWIHHALKKRKSIIRKCHAIEKEISWVRIAFVSHLSSSGTRHNQLIVSRHPRRSCLLSFSTAMSFLLNVTVQLASHNLAIDRRLLLMLGIQRERLASLGNVGRFTVR
eukprot:11996537-Ditylum_brightwellii.AAC.1